MKKTQTYIRSILLLVLLLSSGSWGNAQKVMLLDEALQIALQNNHDIKLSRINTEIIENNATVGNAGLLPTVSLTGNANYSNSNTRLEFLSGQPPIEVNGAGSNSQNVGVNLSYTLFDGLGNINTWNRLKTQSASAAVQEELSVEATIAAVTSAYYDAARKGKNYFIANEAVQVSYERWSRAKTRAEFGGANSLEVLNARVDLQTDSVNLASARVEFENSRRTLLNLMGDRDYGPFVPDSIITFKNDYQYPDLESKLKSNSPNIRLAGQSMKLAELDYKLSKAGYWPRLSLSASYTYSRSQSDANFVSLNQNLGFNGGLSLSYNIFDGRRQKIRVDNAKLGLRSSLESFEQAVDQAETDLDNAWALYTNSLFILRSEQRNLELAQLNFDQTRERYNLGQATSTQIREAQLNLIRSKSRINDLRISAKLAEVELLRLTGGLID